MSGIKKAPSAALTIAPASRSQWPERMKEKFGTPYVKKTDLNVGFDSIAKFWLEVASRFGRQGEAEVAIKKERAAAEEMLEPCRRIFRGRRFAIRSRTLMSLPYIIEAYVRDLGVPVDSIYLDTRRLRSKHLSSAIYDKRIDTVLGIMRGMDLGCEVIAADDGEASSYNKADYILSDLPLLPFENNLVGKTIDMSVINSMFLKMSYTSIVLAGKYLAKSMDTVNRPHAGKLILSRLEYDPLHTYMVTDPGCRRSRELWSANGIDSGY